MFHDNLFRKPRRILLFLGLALLAGCGTRPPHLESQPDNIPGYHQLRETFGSRDFAPLQGRRIVIDPGHGGFFRGAIGPGGLTEAEVNLGVALYLRGLLEWAGAEVHLTRTADYDFLSPADSLLSSDLAFRVNFTNELQPDVFLSIHHNSTASADPTINETQTYYPLGAEGAALDLARCIHRQLVLKLGISPAKILPGNFHVLRNATVPAVLGEPAMISNPVIEGRLSLAASQELEAQAYFLGLLDFFAGGSPSWQPAQADTIQIEENRPLEPLTWTFIPGDRPADPGPDPASYVLTRQGQVEPLHVSADQRVVSWVPDASVWSGPVVLELAGRNLAGRSTPLQRTVIMPAGWQQASFQVACETGPGARRALIRFQLPTGCDPDPGWALVPLLDRDPEEAARSFLATVHPDLDFLGSRSTPLVEGLAWHLLSIAGSPENPVHHLPPGGWKNRLFARPEDQPIPRGTAGLAVLPERPVWIEGRGVLPLVDPAPDIPDTARTIAGADAFWIASPLVPALAGAVIVLDPIGGGTTTDGQGPLGLRGADLNLETARALQHLLEGAGAQVYLTRHGEVSPPDQTKVRLAGDVAADLFLSIGRSGLPDQVTIHHHPGSVNGLAWAQAQARAAATLMPVGPPPPEASIQGSYGYLLRHTACPALEVRLPGLETAAREIEATGPVWPQKEARALLLGCAAALGQTDILENPLDLLEILAALPTDAVFDRVDWALVDGNFSWAVPGVDPVASREDSLSSGMTTAPRDPGLPNLLPRHTLELHGGTAWQLWLLDFTAGFLQPRLMMEGP